jgi:hypothetical protein
MISVTGVRVLAAAATAVTGYVHAELYVDGGFAMSRTVGIFGFTERGLQPAPQALISLVAELTLLASLLAWELMLHRWSFASFAPRLAR